MADAPRNPSPSRRGRGGGSRPPRGNAADRMVPMASGSWFVQRNALKGVAKMDKERLNQLAARERKHPHG